MSVFMPYSLPFKFIFLFFLCVGQVSCVDSERLNDSVYILEILPERLHKGETLSVYGDGFGIRGRNDRVLIAGISLGVLYWSDQRIDCRLPADLQGYYTLIVQTDRFTSQPYPLEVNTYFHED